MATKAQLEAELAELKKLQAERDEQDRIRLEKEAQEEREAEASEMLAETELDSEEAQSDFERQLNDVVESLDDFSHKKPLMLALGAFALGMLVARSR